MDKTGLNGWADAPPFILTSCDTIKFIFFLIYIIDFWKNDKNFKLCGNQSEKWKQLGNTIPTIFTKIIGLNIKKYL